MPLLDLPITASMLTAGLLLGFIGLGGAGLVTALLVGLFGIPVHLAFGTALGAMFTSSVSGSWSHFREGNVDPAIGWQVGLAGVVGAYAGGGLALATGAAELKVLSGLVLMAASGVLFVRSRVAERVTRRGASEAPSWIAWRGVPGSVAIGLVCGAMSGFLSIGVAPWIQVGLLVVKRLSLRRSIGTAMLALGLMSLSGAVRFAQGGQQDGRLLASVVLGLSVGTFVGARYTGRAPLAVVRGTLVTVTILAGLMLIAVPAG